MTLTPITRNDVRGYSDGWKFFPACGSVLDLLFPSAMSWIDEKYLEEGTRCHAEMKRMLELRGPTPDGCWPKSDHPRVSALLASLEQWNFVPVEAEQTRCSHLLGYAGTPDALMKRGELYVVPDWKFAESIVERYEYQLESYRPFFSQVFPSPALMLFQVTREAKVKPMVVRPNAKHWALFLNALAVLKFRLR